MAWVYVRVNGLIESILISEIVSVGYFLFGYKHYYLAWKPLRQAILDYSHLALDSPSIVIVVVIIVM